MKSESHPEGNGQDEAGSPIPRIDLAAAGIDSPTIRLGQETKAAGQHGDPDIKGISKALLRSPVDITVGLAQGLNNAPLLYNDDTVRPIPQVTGIQSGLKAASTSLALGVYDGIMDLGRQPAKGKGAAGIGLGITKGVSGAVLKPIGGVAGFLGYSLKGIQRELQKTGPKDLQRALYAAKIDLGLRELDALGAEQREHIVSAWRGLSYEPLRP